LIRSLSPSSLENWIASSRHSRKSSPSIRFYQSSLMLLSLGQVSFTVWQTLSRLSLICRNRWTKGAQ
jgi:hypothetical protein